MATGRPAKASGATAIESIERPWVAKTGDKVVMHTQPAHVIYVLEGGRTRFTLPDGSTTERDLKPGDAVINPAVTHATENLSDLHVIIVEMKQ